MRRSLVLLMFASLNGAQPQAADFRECHVTNNQPLRPQRHINGAAPVSAIA